MYLTTKHLERVPYPISSTFADCLEGLCYVIENGFSAGYYEHSLPLGLLRDIPAGCAAPEADMSSYESFLKEFDNNVEYLKSLGYDNDEE